MEGGELVVPPASLLLLKLLLLPNPPLRPLLPP
jgi:hypothetical protein